MKAIDDSAARSASASLVGINDTGVERAALSGHSGDRVIDDALRARSSSGQSTGLRNRASTRTVSSSDLSWPGALERFWAKVNKAGPIIRAELGPCWQWTAGVTSAGYGSFGLVTHPRWMVSAHVVSWVFDQGREVPRGLVLMHSCDNRRCVRPDHLSLGTIADNNRDMMAKGRHRFGRRAA